MAPDSALDTTHDSTWDSAGRDSAAHDSVADSSDSAGDTGHKPTPCTILAAGDIARVDSEGDEATADLIRPILEAEPDCIRVLALGDLAYWRGTAEDFADGYEPSWGAFKAQTSPVPGNHEYSVESKGAFYDYFGPLAGAPDQGWLSFDLGAWHIVGLNSNCSFISTGCGVGSDEELWLRADLEASDAACELVFWHHPMFSTGSEHGDDDRTSALWAALEDNGVDVVLNGHDHDYERFALQNGDGLADDELGIREFVVGTGGADQRELAPDPHPTTEVRSDTGWGVLRMDLSADSYSWAFLPAAGNSFTDAGSTDCHGPP